MSGSPLQKEPQDGDQPEVPYESVVQAHAAMDTIDSVAQRQCAMVYEALCQVQLDHYYSSAAVIFAETVSVILKAQRQQQPSTRGVSNGAAASPLRSRVALHSNAVRGTSTVATRAAAPSPKDVRTNSAPRAPASAASRVGIASRSPLRKPEALLPLASTKPVSSVASSKRSVAASATGSVDLSPSGASRRQQSNELLASSGSGEVVTLPIGFRSTTPTRRSHLIPAPAPSVKVLIEERKRCEERRQLLRSQFDGDDANNDAGNDLGADGTRSQSSQRRVSVLYSVPVDHRRTMTAVRSPVKRVSPVRVDVQGSSSSGVGVNDGDGALTLSSLQALPRPQQASPVVVRNRSPMNRLSSANSRISSAAATGVRTSSITPRTTVSPHTRPRTVGESPKKKPEGSTLPLSSRLQAGSSLPRPTSALRSTPVSSLADPRRSGSALRHSTGDTNSQPPTARSSSTALPSSRSTSVQSSQAASMTGAKGIRRPSPASHAGLDKGRPSNKKASSIEPSFDFVFHVLQCGVNRSLEVDFIPNASACAFRVGDLLLDVDGKSMSTLDQLKAHFEMLYRFPSPAAPHTSAVAILRESEYLIVDVPLTPVDKLSMMGGGGGSRAASLAMDKQPSPSHEEDDESRRALSVTAAPQLDEMALLS